MSEYQTSGQDSLCLRTPRRKPNKLEAVALKTIKLDCTSPPVSPATSIQNLKTHSAPSVSVIRVVLQKQEQPRLVVGCGERARDSHLGSSAITSKFKEEFEHEFPQHRMHCSAAALFCTVMSHRLPKLKYNIPNSCNPVRMAPLPDDAGHVHGFPQLGLSFESGRNLLRFRSPEFGTDQKTPSL